MQFSAFIHHFLGASFRIREKGKLNARRRSLLFLSLLLALSPLRLSNVVFQGCRNERLLQHLHQPLQRRPILTSPCSKVRIKPTLRLHQCLLERRLDERIGEIWTSGEAVDGAGMVVVDDDGGGELVELFDGGGLDGVEEKILCSSGRRRVSRASKDTMRIGY